LGWIEKVWISECLLFNETELYPLPQTLTLLSVLLKVLGTMVFICALYFFSLVLLF
jgi:hypothetical protein